MTPAATAEEIAQITSELAELAASGQILPGSICQLHTRCGRPGCACQADPPRPHGPYWQWTRKVAGKTITRRLTEEQAQQYQAWIANDRRVNQLLSRLHQLAINDLETTRHHN